MGMKAPSKPKPAPVVAPVAEANPQEANSKEEALARARRGTSASSQGSLGSGPSNTDLAKKTLLGG